LIVRCSPGDRRSRSAARFGAHNVATIRDERTKLVGHHDVTLQVNGAPHRVALEPRTSLLDALRDTCA
jgi:hypothetical protein